MAQITLGDLIALMKEVEREDAIDFADLPFDEEALRQIVLTSLLEREAEFAAAEPDLQSRLLVYMVSTAKLVLENMVLHARLLRSQGQPVDVAALLSKFG